MAATKVRPKRRRKVFKPAPLGKTTWAILGADAVLRENSYGPGATLALAQQLVSRDDVPDELTIERRDLFGPPALLYTVHRDPDTGHVSTTIHSHED